MTKASAILARSITCEASKQSYYTARYMVDEHLKDDCCRAYGYFRWVDDVVDESCVSKLERTEFIKRQIVLADQFSRGDFSNCSDPEEEMLADLIRNDRGESPLLYSYVHNFLAIIAFDAERKDRIISHQELDWYANTLAKAVTDGILYFVGNDQMYPFMETRYLAATAAHIVHMLRDLLEDFESGYYNIPGEILQGYGVDWRQLDHPVIRTWVHERVLLARKYFRLGKLYLDRLPNLRSRIVAYWYCARFEGLLDIIEADNYQLRKRYEKPPKALTWGKYLGIGMTQTWQHSLPRFSKDSERFVLPLSRLEDV